MDILVGADGHLVHGAHRMRCALGRAGIRRNKREGDGATPAGTFPLRDVLYRADRLGAEPQTILPARSIEPDDGWCDDPADAAYNRPVRLPHGARCEALWRSDHLYDLVVVVGYNDAPVRPGLGSAIFIHVAAPDDAPTEGCVALAVADLLAVLRRLQPGDRLVVDDRAG